MIRRTTVFGLMALATLLAGCASAQSAEPSRSGTAAPSASSGAADGPTKTALMVCGEDISAQVKLVLKLDSPAPTRTSFADDLYSCTYELPLGPLALSVHHSDAAAAADSYFDRQRALLDPTTELIGLGERAFRAPAGITVVMKDNEVLTVDASALPAVFGPDQQMRSDLAYEIASDVLGCWTGDGDE